MSIFSGTSAIIGLMGGGAGAEQQAKTQEQLYKDEAEDVRRQSVAADAEIERKYGRFREVQAVEQSIAGIDPYSGSLLAARQRDQAEVERDRLYNQGNAAAQRRRLLYQGSVARAEGKNRATMAKISGFYTIAAAALTVASAGAGAGVAAAGAAAAGAGGGGMALGLGAASSVMSGMAAGTRPG